MRRRERVSMSELVREAVEAFVDERRLTAVERAHEVGCA